MSTRRCALAVLLLVLAFPSIGSTEGEDVVDDQLEIAVIPRPAKVERRRGFFRVDDQTRVRPVGWAPSMLAEHAAKALRDGTGQPVTAPETGPGNVLLGCENVPASWGKEGYRLEVRADRVKLMGQPAGVFRGIQTLRQLVQGDRIPCVLIEDRPRFRWRGLHLDVGRHLFPVEDVKRYIDALAFFKMNTFHWHLTEDQGWRIEIKKYPKLTSVGSMRKESPKPGNRNEGDGTPYGGFYTQEEVKEIVRYAAERFITVVPEIEMPGHAQAAIAAYPELGNTEEKLEVRTRWGVSRHVYNVEDSTFEFLQDVLDEVLELFPSKFVHIGGDECPKHEWKASPKAQTRMKAEGLADEHELQSWFIRRIERYLASKGRRLIGWDEIQEGGLPPGAAMMVWRSTKYGVDAVKAGHDIVMSPTSHCYFDYYQGAREHEPEAIGGFLPLHRVYGFEPIPEGLEADEAARVLGAQGNLWTEYMRDMDHVLYMAWPRGAALAEVVWSPAEMRNYEDFLRRWFRVAPQLSAMGINYRLEPPVPVAGALISSGPVDVAFEAAPAGHVIRYTFDGSVPEGDAPRYDGPVRVEKTAALTAAMFTPDGRRSAPVTVDVVRYEPQAVGEVQPGLLRTLYRGAFDKVPDFDTLEPVATRAADVIGLIGNEPEGNFALRFDGYLRVDEPGLFTFEMGSDDGSLLWIAGAKVVRLDGLHGYATRVGRVHLEKGLYPFRVGYFERGGAQRLTFAMEGPGQLVRPVTGSR